MLSLQGHSETFTGFCQCHHFDLTGAGTVFFFFFFFFAQTLGICDTGAQSEYFMHLATQKLSLSFKALLFIYYPCHLASWKSRWRHYSWKSCKVHVKRQKKMRWLRGWWYCCGKALSTLTHVKYVCQAKHQCPASLQSHRASPLHHPDSVCACRLVIEPGESQR